MIPKLPLAQGETARTASAPVVLRTAVDETSGEVLTARVLAERAGWAADLVAGMAASLVATHWNSSDVDALACGRDASGVCLPSRAWMALRRLGWSVTVPEAVVVNDRIVRMAQEQAGRTLRAAKWRADLAAGILLTWPTDPGKRTPDQWDAVRAVIPGGQHLPGNVITARTRHLVAFADKQGRLPADIFEAEAPPRTARILLLAACDRQQATIERGDTPVRALLRLQLPTRPDPRSYRDWTWVSARISLPPTIPADAVLHLPTLRLHMGVVRADLAYTHPVPQTRRTGHTVALAIDWGLNTLLSAGAVRRHDDGRLTALGAGAQFRAGGVLAKAHRLRRLSECLHAKTDHYQRLIGESADHPLTAKHTVLAVERSAVSARRSHLNDALATSAARWAVDQAITAGATVIFVEDLRSLEAKGMGRTLNTRLSQQVRGQLTDRMRHLAAEVGIAVVIVPPRNTSRHCPGCLSPLRHRKAPDRPTTSGWKWASCPDSRCGWQGDRDTGAWQRIAARGLTHQYKTVTEQPSGNLVIRTVIDTLEASAVLTATAPPICREDRSKSGPTRPRPTRPAPRRRRAPSPIGPSGAMGQRPEGHAPTGPARLPRAADRHQDVSTISTSSHRHRARGAALGAGFHLHAHATRPRWEIPLPDTPSGPGSLS
ncbi:zinc ribbon domain-containing protein [Nocardia sp. NPDC051030]|uniref:zinc ribbon domain-containing protein n=1 Tax=Nocardia sp. NPDC051030 TaxID=3155162 RepID=UPI003434CA95